MVLQYTHTGHTESGLEQFHLFGRFDRIPAQFLFEAFPGEIGDLRQSPQVAEL